VDRSRGLLTARDIQDAAQRYPEFVLCRVKPGKDAVKLASEEELKLPLMFKS
jgi:hypothetical protein